MKRQPPLLRRNNDKCDYRRGDNAAAVSRLGGGQIRRVARRKRHQLYSVLARGIWPEPSGPERPVAREPDCLRDHLSPINSFYAPTALPAHSRPLSLSLSAPLPLYFSCLPLLPVRPASSPSSSFTHKLWRMSLDISACRGTGRTGRHDSTRARTGSYQSGLSDR